MLGNVCDSNQQNLRDLFLQFYRFKITLPNLCLQFYAAKNLRNWIMCLASILVLVFHWNYRVSTPLHTLTKIFLKNSRNFLRDWFLLGKMCSRKSSWKFIFTIGSDLEKLVEFNLSIWG